MATFGWAYVDCADSGGDGAAAGPTGSLQFVTGASGHTTGSSKLVYYTASYGEHTEPSTLVLSGNMIITGTISASVFNYENISIIDATGSTFFGNTIDDRHFRTGSLAIWSGTTAVLSASSYSKQTFVRGFGGNYTNVTSSHYTASTDDYLLGVATPFTGGAAPVRITIPDPSTYSAGAILVIKDEATNRGGSNITLTRSVTETYTFDGDPFYVLTGTMPAISLYSNGSNWFVF
tara:strand:+ start:275 stop:976 length:702 start_codon:yes stop_codon:yes gene_type:complete